MDIAEFAESITGRELPKWQKECLRTAYEFHQKNPDERILIPVRPRQGYDVFYTYFKEYMLKELTQSGKTLNSNKEMSVMRKEC